MTQKSTWLNPLIKRFDVVRLRQNKDCVFVVLKDQENNQVEVGVLTQAGTLESDEILTFNVEELEFCLERVWVAIAQVFRQSVLKTEIEEIELDIKKQRKKKRKKVIKLLAQQFKLSKAEIKFIYNRIKDI